MINIMAMIEIPILDELELSLLVESGHNNVSALSVPLSHEAHVPSEFNLLHVGLYRHDPFLPTVCSFKHYKHSAESDVQTPQFLSEHFTHVNLFSADIPYPLLNLTHTPLSFVREHSSFEIH